MDNERILEQLNDIVASIEGNYREVEIKEIRDGIISDSMIFVTKDTTDRRVVFIFNKNRALLSIVRQIIPNRFFKYDGSGTPQKNCYNLYCECHKNRNYTISL